MYKELGTHQYIGTPFCHPRQNNVGIAPTFINLDLWSPGAGFIPIISTKGINQIKKGKL